MYTPVLTLHSWLRWGTLLLALAATLNALRPDPDVSQRMPGRHWDSLFMAALDLQMLFGLMLYFRLSPFPRQAFANFSAAMSNGTLRFWAVDHLLYMFAAAVVVRIGRVRAMNAPTGEARRKRRFVFFALTTLLIVAGIPWPGLVNGRPLFRLW